MKKYQIAFAWLIIAALVTACGDSNTTKTTTTDTTNTAAGSTSNNTNNNNNTAATSTTNAKLPLTPADSTFVMKAAIGGMREVEAGNLAQQNAQSERVKAFGSLMIRDHQSANQELMSLASGRGLTLPTTLPADVRQHLDKMRNMKGKAFDNHYMNMMVNDHQKTITDFEKQASGGGDAELKAWATKMLPTLQIHRDSATAINKGMK